MAEIIDNTLTCSFCNCTFKVTKEDVKTCSEFSSAGTYHTNHYQYIECPICGSKVKQRLILTTY